VRLLPVNSIRRQSEGEARDGFKRKRRLTRVKSVSFEIAAEKSSLSVNDSASELKDQRAYSSTTHAPFAEVHDSNYTVAA
jgi:hypothetical protein